MEEEPENQYGLLEGFKLIFWSGSKETNIKASDDNQISKKYRKNIYSTLAIDDNKLKDFSKMLTTSSQILGVFSVLNNLGDIFEEVIVSLYSKKETLKKLGIPNLDKLKNLFEKLLSIKTTVSETMRQLLLDYQNNKNSINTDINKLNSHAKTIYNQMKVKKEKAYELQREIFSINK
ncbi:virulence associated lipoprotein [Borreliella andersonii]|uniref:virulence associated lipoprotein n=1 Tax=Borrelia andersonii TaxID=42109 RepID=UPI00292F9621|nr:virulence associated lipoprotein [Borreliella andersonii]